MTVQEIIDAMVPVFREVLDADDIELTEATTAEAIIEWDSLNHVQLLHSIEQRFGVEIPQAEAATFKNVGDMARAISVKLAPR
ncbi:MAG: acyl carrier protein [Myxococcota bacterium]|jgi:acyl carrier protein|nr:acyl carrier protein [Myxococcota bacterium]